MAKADILEQLKQAVLDLDDEEVFKLLEQGLKAGLLPMEMITDGLSAGLSIIGDAYENHQRFISDLVLSGEIMNDALEMLRPELEKGGKSTGNVMVIGTIEGDQHFLGKRIVSAMFTGAGYQVVDIGENQPASEFVKAAKDLKAKVVGASAILATLRPYCKTIDDGLIDAGIRDNLIYVVGGWGMNQEWCDKIGADAYGEDAYDGLNKVKLIQAGELPRLSQRLKI